MKLFIFKSYDLVPDQTLCDDYAHWFITIYYIYLNQFCV